MTAAALWVAIVVATGVTELRWGNRRKVAVTPDGAPVGAARATDDGLQICFLAALVGPVVTGVVTAVHADAMSLVIGGLAGVAGVVLRVSAMRTLGERFMLQLSEQPDAPRLVRSGCYAVVRHPGYTAMSLVVVGLGLVAAGPVGMLWSLPTLALVTLRVRVEERMLAREFGAEYDDYRRAVPGRLVPRVW